MGGHHLSLQDSNFVVEAKNPLYSLQVSFSLHSAIGDSLFCSLPIINHRNLHLSPMEPSFHLPSPLPNWPPGNGFASGSVDLGGLEVTQITSFRKIWASQEGGPGNLGVTLYEPSTMPDEYFLLGSYAQPNNKPLFGWVLVGKDLTDDPSDGALAKPIDYTLIWSSQSLTIKQDGPVYIWLPTPPDGYKAMGLVVTTSPGMPPLDKIRCVCSDFTDNCETGGLIWGSNGLNIYAARPTNIGVQDMGVSLGTFTTTTQSGTNSITTCLKNAEANLSYMPNLAQIKTLVQVYSPYIYIHPEENYHPSSVNWFFANGALLYKQGDESNPVPIQQDGINLPLGGSNDGSYWLDLPAIDKDKERVKKGDLDTAVGYLHIKPMLGATFTDIAIWVFYPFNGAAKAKLGFIKSISLGKIGEHVGDWEHITLRISNFNGELRSVYFSQHSKGTWVDAPSLEFQNGNRVVGYASQNGHALYPDPGLVLQGNNWVGIRNDTAKSNMVLDVGARYETVSADYDLRIVEPSWVNYMRKWGPKITYDVGKEINEVARLLPGKLKSDLENLASSLPAEVLEEEGPTGPKVKQNWNGDET